MASNEENEAIKSAIDKTERYLILGVEEKESHLILHSRFKITLQLLASTPKSAASLESL